MQYQEADFELLAKLEKPGTIKHKRLRARANAAGALIRFGDLEMVNRTILLNYLVERKQAAVKSRQENRQNRPQSGNRYGHVRTVGKIGQAEEAIRKAVGPRQSAIDALYAQLDSETDMYKRSIISSRLGKKLADKEAADIRLEQLAARRAEIEKDTKSRIEQGRKAKSKKTDSTDGKSAIKGN